MGVPMRPLAVRTAAMTCPFLSRLPSQFVKNYSSKLLKTYGEHCPVVSHGASQTLASPGPLSGDPALCQEGAAQGVSKCPMGGAALHTQSSGPSPVRQVAATVDDIEERHGFNYESFFDQQIQKKKMDLLQGVQEGLQGRRQLPSCQGVLLGQEGDYGLV